MNINQKNFKSIILIFSLLLILGVAFYFYLTKNIKQSIHQPCLSDNEVADFDYNVDLYNSTGVKLPINATTTIYIKDKNDNKEIFRFTINDVVTNSDTLETHQCGVYVIRNFDFDKKKGFYRRHEFWYYSYNGNGKILMINEELRPYDLIVRVDPFENHLALTRYYLGHPEHSVVIKNLKTPKLDDVLVIKPDDIWQKFPQLDKERRIGVVGWTSDGKYLWGGSESQTDYVYFRINIDDKEKKKIDVFPMPDDAVHYGPPRLDTGYIWYIYGMPWVGFEEDAKRLAEEWRKEGKKKTLFLYNLFTKEKTTLATVDNPDWNFKPKWLSDTELQYEMPSGEKKVYNIIHLISS